MRAYPGVNQTKQSATSMILSIFVMTSRFPNKKSNGI